jgi:anhydro-N-acetylmuramic acid kinase
MSMLNSLTEKRSRLIVGLMSGTSADGIDAALIRLNESGNGEIDVSVLAFETVPYPEGLREALFRLSSAETGRVDEVCRMNFVLGELFAGAAQKVAASAGVAMSALDLIGSHGQTIHHLPRRETWFGVSVGATLQIGDPSVIAQRAGVITVGDFRPADMARGGQGAPLVPYVDYLLFRSSSLSRILLNIGGIANMTVIPAGARPEEVMAFDTGPGNMVIDAVTGALTGEAFDRDGACAARGTVLDDMIENLMTLDYFDAPPPKSTGRERFGQGYADALMKQGKRRGLDTDDLIATVSEVTVRSIYDSYVRFVRPRMRADEVIVSGGGARNRHLMARLAERFCPASVVSSDDRGLSSDAKEAVAFAILANETVMGRHGNMPGATGADRSCILGKICLP